ncbi:MAG: hypothetical protein RW306_16060 [Geobacteraceae bacterium]|nr:hypothetical protein [Geobacteraceae bacterium]
MVVVITNSALTRSATFMQFRAVRRPGLFSPQPSKPSMLINVAMAGCNRAAVNEHSHSGKNPFLT